MKRSCADFGYYSGTYLKRLRKTTRH